VHYFRLRAGAPIPDAAHDEPIAALGVDDAGGARGGPALAVRDVTVRFGGLAAVEGLSLELGRGEILALIGPNGAGKSTAFNVITGFQPPDRGRVELDGTPITGLAPYRIAERRLCACSTDSVFAEAPPSTMSGRVPPPLPHVARASDRVTSAARRDEHGLAARARHPRRRPRQQGGRPRRNLSCGDSGSSAWPSRSRPRRRSCSSTAGGGPAHGDRRLMQLIGDLRAAGWRTLVEHDMKLVRSATGSSS
jgi:hypothetical protein